MKVIRIGVIGCGYWGPNLVRNFVEISDAEVVAVADLDDNRLSFIKARYPQIQITTQDYHQLFQLDLDAVIISTPPSTHFQITMDCLEHGLHVFVEKPLTLKSSEAAVLIEIARQKHLILMVGHTFAFNPAVRALKEIIANGELGVVHHIDAVRANLGLFQSDLNVLWDLAPHDISILIYILGQLPAGVSAQGMACIHPYLEDVAYMTLEFPNDIMANIRTSWLDPVKTRRVTIVGSEKMLIYDDVSPSEKIKIFDIGVKTNTQDDAKDPLQFAYKRGDVTIPYIQNSEPLRLECTHFLACIQEDGTPLTSGESGLTVVQIIEAAQESLVNGGISVPIYSPTKPSETKDKSTKSKQVIKLKHANAEA
jgi:predicted dehydrogenase